MRRYCSIVGKKTSGHISDISALNHSKIKSEWIRLFVMTNSSTFTQRDVYVLFLGVFLVFCFGFFLHILFSNSLYPLELRHTHVLPQSEPFASKLRRWTTSAYSAKVFQPTKRHRLIQSEQAVLLFRQCEVTAGGTVSRGDKRVWGRAVPLKDKSQRLQCWPVRRKWTGFRFTV